MRHKNFSKHFCVNLNSFSNSVFLLSESKHTKKFFFRGCLHFKRKIGQFVGLLEFRLSISYSTFLQKPAHNKYAWIQNIDWLRFSFTCETDLVFYEYLQLLFSRMYVYCVECHYLSFEFPKMSVELLFYPNVVSSTCMYLCIKFSLETWWRT
jgi:hypothetical protein